MPAGGSAARPMTGVATGLNCDVNSSGNTGCGVQAPTPNSYGPVFNANGGGWYAMERTNTFIKIWFWPRNAAVPSDVQNGGNTVNTGNWVALSVSYQACTVSHYTFCAGHTDSFFSKHFV